MTAVGILLMAYGGPDSLEDVEPYLLDVRGGRPTSPELIEEIRERYAAIGGRSPLLEITRRQGEALAEELNRRKGTPGFYHAYVGMRHWSPRVHQAVQQMQADGIEKAVALVMAPHYSQMSIAVYLRKLEEARQAAETSIDVLPIQGWHDHPGLIAAIAEKARLALQRFSGAQPYIVFTAHSLPSRILAQGDPYADQLQETARLLAQSLNLEQGRWRFSFQSAGRTGEPWLGPQIEEVIPELAAEGETNLLIVPVGFVADHVEVLYDIDIEARSLAQSYGARLERSDSLNDSPALISALADLVEARLQQSEIHHDINGGA